MSFLKFTADNIFTGTTMLDAGNVLITTEDGIIETIIPAAEAGDDIQYHPGIISPGFINSHCHLELSHMKGLIPEKTGLVDFVITVMQSRSGGAEEVIFAAIEKAETDMLQKGIVAVGDICNTAYTIPQKQKGNLHYYNFVEATGFAPQFAEKRFHQAEEVYGQFVKSEKIKVKSEELNTYNNPRYNNLQSAIVNLQSIVPHAPYSTSTQLMQLINQHSAGKVITIHNQETQDENSFFLAGESAFRKLFSQFNIDISFFYPSGKSSLQTYLPELHKAGKLILVHNTFTSEEDAIFAQNQSSIVNRETGKGLEDRPVYSPPLGDGGSTVFCLCPNANLYIENTLPPVDMLRKNACNIVLGTDSLASNHSLSILDEIKTLHRHFPHIPLNELLQWATLNGAKALQMDSLLGSFEKGKQPGVIRLQENLEGVERLV